MDGFDDNPNFDQGDVAVDPLATAIPTEVATPGAETTPESDNVVAGAWYTVGEFVVLVEDTDGDNGADTAWIDVDEDGVADIVITEAEGGYLLTDLSGAHADVWLTTEELLASHPELVTLLDTTFGEDEVVDPQAPEDGGNQQWVQDGRLVGDPAGAAQYWFEQAANGFCLPASIAQVVSEYTGIAFTNEQAFVDIANDLGAFVVGPDGVPGLTLDSGVAIFHEVGIPAEAGFGDLAALEAHLEAGFSIIVAVDSGELWMGEAQEDMVADHALVVTGIDHERGTVLLSDPGTPGGNLAEYPIGLFDNAWGDSQHAWIVVEQPAGGNAAVDAGPAPEQGVGVAAPADGGVQPAATGPQGLGNEAQPGPFDTEAFTEQVMDSIRNPDLSEVLPDDDTFIERTTAWAVQHPWILIPVALVAGRLMTRPANG